MYKYTVLTFALFTSLLSTSYAFSGDSKRDTYKDVNNCMLSVDRDIGGKSNKFNRLRTYLNLRMVSKVKVWTFKEGSKEKFQVKLDIPSGGEFNFFLNEDETDELVDEFNDCVKG